MECPGGPFLNLDNDSSYIEDPYTLKKGLNPLGKGVGKAWPYGAENWCNLEGRYLHLVADHS